MDIGLNINVEKPKAMEMKMRRRIGRNWSTRDDNIQVGQDFYLNDNVNNNCYMTQLGEVEYEG